MAGPSGIPSYSTTPATNATADGGASNWAENQAPSTVNNTARQNLADIRSAFNDLIWFSYGSGDQASGATYLGVPYVYASSTSVTVAGVNVTAAHHAGRRMKFVGATTGTIYGTISSSSFSTNTTINLVFDSGSLSNETLTGYLSQVPVTGKPIPASATSGAGVIYLPTTGGTSGAVTLTNSTPLSAYANGQLFLFRLTNATSNGTTINVDGLGAVQWSWFGNSIRANAFIVNDDVLVEYDSNLAGFNTIAPFPRVANSNLTISGTLGAGATTITNNTTGALTVGQNGATNPAFQVDASQGTSVTGLKVQSNATSGDTLVSAISSDTDTSIQLNAKGAGSIKLQTTGTGNVTSATPIVITSTNANSFAVGRQGSTNPVLQVDASTGSVATGIKIKGAAAAAGVAVSVITSGTNENLTLDAAGSGTITIAGTSTGAITLTRATTLSAALTYGGVTLSNAVTGTGNMVLSASPTLTGTLTAATVVSAGITATVSGSGEQGVITLSNSAAGTTNTSELRIRNDLNANTSSLFVGYTSSTYSGAFLTGGVSGESAFIATGGSKPLAIGTNFASAINIGTNQHVQIGTTTDSAMLTVNGTGQFNGLLTLNGTAATTSRVLDASGTTTGGIWGRLFNTGGQTTIGVESSAGGALFTGGSAYASIVGTSTATSLQLGTNGVVNHTITSGAIAVTQNASGFGIGMTPSNVLDITQSTNGAAVFKFLNASSGTSAEARIALDNGTSTSFVRLFGGSYTTGLPNRQDGLLITAAGAGGLTIGTTVSQPLYMIMNGNEVARFDTSGRFLQGRTSAYNVGNVFSLGGAAATLDILNTNASTPAGFTVVYTGAAPNNTSSEFLFFSDTGGTRCTVRSNGGLVNYSANNVNLSDAEAKPQIEPLISNERLASDLWNAHRQIDWNRHKYADQTHDDWNYGYTAQGIQKAFGAFAPELVERDPAFNGMLVVYHHDISNISGAVLTMAQDRIEDHEARIRRLEGVQ